MREGETILLDLDGKVICASTGICLQSAQSGPQLEEVIVLAERKRAWASIPWARASSHGPQNTMEEAKYLKNDIIDCCLFKKGGNM